MGWFGKKKEASSDYYNAADVEDGSLPVAVAVVEPQPPPKQTIASNKVAAAPSTALVTKSQIQQQQQLRAPPPILFLTRVPMMLNPCPICQTPGRTRVRTFPNWMTWLLVLALLFIFWPLCWIPLVTDSMKQTDHYCMACQQRVGSIGPCRDCCVKNRT